jgi:hypothetical protein
MGTTKGQSIIHTFQVSNTAIQVQNESFQRGYQHGYRRFSQRYAQKPLADWDVYRFVLRNILDTYTTELECAGYVTGWMAALVELMHTTSEQEERRNTDAHRATKPKDR